VDAGATDATVFEIELDEDALYPSHRLREVERTAIEGLQLVGTPMPRRTESFRDVSYRDAVGVVRRLDRHRREVSFPGLPTIRRLPRHWRLDEDAAR
jgi:hypothetical protein